MKERGIHASQLTGIKEMAGPSSLSLTFHSFHWPIFSLTQISGLSNGQWVLRMEWREEILMGESIQVPEVARERLDTFLSPTIPFLSLCLVLSLLLHLLGRLLGTLKWGHLQTRGKDTTVFPPAPPSLNFQAPYEEKEQAHPLSVLLSFDVCSLTD